MHRWKIYTSGMMAALLLLLAPMTGGAAEGGASDKAKQAGTSKKQDKAKKTDKAQKGVKPEAAPVAPASVPPAPRPDVKHWTLGNGLEVLYLADRRAPVVTVQVFYHAGSKDEERGLRGIAHMFEHMMFKGTKNIRPEDHARFLDQVGGSVNAFTAEDITGYHDTLPREHMGFALRLEADRMRNLLLTPSTVKSEREVVKEEKRMRVDASPIGRMQEKFLQMTFTKHPYAWSPAGFLDELDRVTPADCQAFYDTYYVPNNATLIVVGDVEEAEVRRQAEEAFGQIPRGKAPPRVVEPEPPQTAMRDEKLDFQAQMPVIFGGYHIPEASHADIPALQVVGQVLSSGQSSRMYRRLVKQDKLALFAGGFVRAMEQPGLFMVFALHLPASDQDKLKAGLLDEIERVRKSGITAEELEKAKNQLTMGYVSSLESVTGIATMLGYHQYVFGGWEKFLDSLERYQRVTAADVERVAKKYLATENLTLVALVPGGAKKEGAK